MSFKVCRKPFRIGASHAITLPYAWCQYYGDRINTSTIFGGGVLVIAPEGLEAEARRMIEEVEAMKKSS